MIDGPAKRSAALFTQNVLEQAYAKLGIKLVYSNVPLARSYIEANNGTLDGLRARVDRVSNEYQNLIQIPVPLLTFTIVLILDKSQCGECKLEALRRVGTARGFKSVEHQLNENPLPFKVQQFTSQTQTLDLLKAKKLQGAILAEAMLRDAHFDQAENWKIQILAKADLYHYLHKKHHALVMPLSEVLNKIKEDGDLAILKKQFSIHNEIRTAAPQRSKPVKH